MKMLSHDQINEIKNSVNIVDVVSKYISLSKKGRNYFGECKFHKDSTPSLCVSPDKQIYNCFSCHRVGNVFQFLMEYENVSFVESVKMVADMVGINVDIDYKNVKSVKNNEICKIYDVSHKFYLNNINTQYGKLAKDYLYKRNINDDLIKEFEIGLAIKDSKSLSNVLLKKEFKEHDLIDSGLIVKDERGFHDFFYDRIMFPLHNMNDQVIGYSGRIYTATDNPKYVNSKEHAMFKKREFVYNYSRAKNECRIKNTVIIMEGFMDVIRTYSIDVKNVVAILGTAFTEKHANIIKKMADNVVICFDGDEAGEKATMICSDILLENAVIPKVVRLEENLDPDEYILKYGKDKFLDKINNPISVMDFKLQFLKKGKDLRQLDDKSKYATEVIEHLNKLDDDMLKELTLKKLSIEIDLDINFLKNKLTKKEVKQINKEKVAKTNKYEIAQLGLLFYMLRSVDVIKMFDNRTIYFPVKQYRMLAHEISYFYKNNNYIDESELLIDIDKDLLPIIGKIETLNLNEEVDNNIIIDYFNTIEEKNIDDECARLTKLMYEETNLDEQFKLGQRILELRRRRENNV